MNLKKSLDEYENKNVDIKALAIQIDDSEKKIRSLNGDIINLKRNIERIMNDI